MMPNPLRRYRLVALLSCLSLVTACGLFGYPKVSAPAVVKLPDTPEALERGRYLASHVAACIGCHSERQWDRLAGPVRPGTEGKGGEKFGRDAGYPGDYYASNLTPYGIGQWTDGELVRAFTTGVNPQGRSLFPLMPYLNYGKMSPEDALAIAAYIRTLKPVENKVPLSNPKFPLNFIIPTIPQDAMPGRRPEPSEGATYGEYVANVAACIDCHSKAVRGKKIEGMEYAGGFEFRLPGGVIRSANITPDVETGIGAWSRQTFIAKFKDRDPAKTPPPALDPGEINSPMPWTLYAGMTEQDLGAIYDYLKTLKPVTNLVKQTD